ncbi:MAG: energy-coupling factor transporter ATPase [Clostridia bacterium]|nr:energy-coupling factor transporter ATPase [Clostridia bacterium]
MDKDKPIISFDNVFFGYSSAEDEQFYYAVHDATFDIYEGEFVAVVGKNGSGKSTIAKLMNAILEPSDEGGSVTVFGIDTKKGNKYEVRKRVGMVFQNPDNSMVASIVEDDIAFGPENLGLEREEIVSRVDNAISLLGIENLRTRTPHKLSGGQKQKIAIAGILALKPDVLVLDESTAMLDPQGRKEVIQTLIKLNKQEKITIVLITHFMEEVLFADRVLVVNQGSVKLVGTPKDIFLNCDKLIEYGLTIPRLIELESKLRQSGLDVTQGENNVELLAKEVAAVLSDRFET